jgi:hypothetical protein
MYYILTQYTIWAAINSEGEKILEVATSLNDRKAASAKLKFHFGDYRHYLKLKKVKNVDLTN